MHETEVVSVCSARNRAIENRQLVIKYFIWISLKCLKADLLFGFGVKKKKKRTFSWIWDTFNSQNVIVRLDCHSITVTVCVPVFNKGFNTISGFFHLDNIQIISDWMLSHCSAHTWTHELESSYTETLYISGSWIGSSPPFTDKWSCVCALRWIILV